MNPSLNRMKEVFILIVLALIGHSALSQPRLSFDKRVIDLGTIYQGDTAALAIPVGNSGNRVLRIRDISTSCECTTASLTQKEIAPGNTARIAVAVNSAGLQGDLEKQIIVRSNDPATPSAIIVLKVSVKSEIEPLDKQYNLWLGNVSTGKTKKMRIAYRNISEHAFDVIGGSSSSPDVTVAADAGALQPNQVGGVEIAVTPSREGYAQVDCYVRIAGKHQRSMMIALTYIGVKSE